MKRLVWSFIFFLLALKSFAVEIIKPEQIQPGMKGYGLTVLSGYQVERFEVEVIDIIPKAMAGTDFILVRCSGAGLEKSRLISGMSGSPVYFEGKLAGAISATWQFAQEPIGALTPIGDMIEGLKIKSAQAQTAFVGSLNNQAQLYPGLDSRGCVVLVSGLDSNLLGEAKRLLEPINLGPIMAGGKELDDPKAPGKIEPGSAVGVALVSGDLNISVVGTATLVEGNTVLAFGHQFFNGGAVSLPLILAKVHTVIPSQNLSFKLASPVREIGALFLDSYIGIAGKLGEKAQMIPIKIEVDNKLTRSKREFNYSIADYPYLIPYLSSIVLYQSLSSAGATSQLTTVELDMALKLKGFPEPITYRDRFLFRGDSFSREYLLSVNIFMNNPFKEVKISELNFNLAVKPGWEMAEIKSIWANKIQVSPGETVLLGVRLKPYQGEEFDKTIELKIPDDAKKVFNLTVLAGENMPLDIAPPESVEDLIKAFNQIPNSNWLVLQYPKPGIILDYQGGRLRSLPPSIQSILSGWGDTKAKRTQDFEYLTYPTNYLIKGKARIQFQVINEQGRKKK